MTDGWRWMELARSSPKPIPLSRNGTRPTSGRPAPRLPNAHGSSGQRRRFKRIVSAAARQAGMIRARNFRTTVNYAKAFSLPPVKAGGGR